jgi:glutaredoxin
MKELLVIYGIPNCEWCIELKKALITIGYDYDWIDLSKHKNEEFLTQIINITGSDNIPVVKYKNNLYAPYKSYKTIDDLINLIKDA